MQDTANYAGAVVLAIETSGPRCVVAARDRAGNTAARVSVELQSHSEDIIELIDQVLAELSLTVNDVNVYLPGIGPGSFTGLRIGMATIKGLVTAGSGCIVPIPSLLAFAAPFLSTGVPVLSIADARRGELFSAGYQVMAGSLVELLKLAIRTPAELKEWIREQSDLSLVLTGTIEECTLLQDVCAYRTSQQVGEAMIELFECSLWKGNPVQKDGLASLEPLYIRAVAARTVKERTELG